MGTRACDVISPDELPDLRGRTTVDQKVCYKPILLVMDEVAKVVGNLAPLYPESFDRLDGGVK